MGDSGSSSPSPQRDSRKGGREGGSWGDNPPPFLPLWAQPPTLTSPPSAGARTPPNPVAPLAPTPRLRQRHSHPPPPLPQPGWGGGQPPRPPTPLRWGQERDGRRREEGAKRDVEEGMGKDWVWEGGQGRGLVGKGYGPTWERVAGERRGGLRGRKDGRDTREERWRPCELEMGVWTGNLGEESPNIFPSSFSCPLAPRDPCGVVAGRRQFSALLSPAEFAS